MTRGRGQGPKNLGEVEQVVMDLVWSRGPVTAEGVRERLAGRRPMKESTVRTMLRRLEEKGYVVHTVEGRTYVYRAVEARQNVAARAARHIIERFCGGSVEQLLVGMVEADVLDPEELEQLARKIAHAKEKKS